MLKKALVIYGSPVAAGRYECPDCGHVTHSDQSRTCLPPCPNLDRFPHYQMAWRLLGTRASL